jgi:Erv1 / Alr family
MNFNPVVWGPHYWFFLHTIALNYPHHPTAIVKKRYYDFLVNLHLFLPNIAYGSYYSALLDKYPLSPYMDSNKSLVKWMNIIHNEINKKLEKPLVSLDQFYLEYTTQNENNPNTKRIIKISIYFVIILLCILFIIKQK